MRKNTSPTEAPSPDENGQSSFACTPPPQDHACGDAACDADSRALGAGETRTTSGEDAKTSKKEKKCPAFHAPSFHERHLIPRAEATRMTKPQLIDAFMEEQAKYQDLLRDYNNLYERRAADNYDTFVGTSDRLKTLEGGKQEEKKKGTNDKSQEEASSTDEKVQEDDENEEEEKEKKKPKRTKGFNEGRSDNLPVCKCDMDFSADEIASIFGDHKYQELPTEEIVDWRVIPARIYVFKRIVHVYKDLETNLIYRTVKASDVKFLPGSVLTPSLLALLAERYYGEGISVTRQIGILENEGGPLTKQEVYTWFRRFGTEVCCVVAARMLELVLEYPAIQSDETYWKCIEDALNSNRKFCYFWLVRSSEMLKDRPQIVTATFVKSRSSDDLQYIIGDFEGSCACDGHSAYSCVANAAKKKKVKFTISNCLSHVRMYFAKVIKAIPGFSKMSKEEKMQIPAYVILTMLKAVFKKEKELKDLSREERAEKRRTEILPAVYKVYEEIDNIANDKEHPVQTGSLIDVAIKYAKNRKDSVLVGVMNPDLPIHNCASERVFSANLSVLRNNSKAFFSLQNGEIAGDYLTISCTCKENNVNPEAYFRFLFEVIRPVIQANMDRIRKGDLSFLDEYMPWGEIFKEYEEKYREEARTLQFHYNTSDEAVI